ncbi:MAG: YlxR family protein [Anaerolineae bacterium]|nr:YlxR family protein [Anaerolineae bacterium]
MPRPKHLPQRMCVVCRSKDNKRRLTRLVRSEQGILIDPTGKAHGRGAYLCDDPKCWARAIASDVLDKALKTSLQPEDRQRLSQAAPGL